jgi:hypothetical protein
MFFKSDEPNRLIQLVYKSYQRNVKVFLKTKIDNIFIFATKIDIFSKKNKNTDIKKKFFLKKYLFN